MKHILLSVLLVASAVLRLNAAPRYSVVVDPTNNTVTISYTNRFFEGVCTVEGRIENRWVPLKNFFTLHNIGVATLPLPTNNATEYRLRCRSVAPGNAFVHLAQSYGKITTIAGNGGQPAGTNWLPEYEGALATTVPLSNPTSAMADDAGNIFIADRDGHAVLKVTPDGRIRTVAGTHQPGFLSEGPTPGTNQPLHSPTTLHVVNNVIYILDSGNSRIRVLDQTPAGNVTTIGVVDPVLATNLAGLWVVLDAFGAVDEIFYGAGTELKRYSAGNDNFTSTVATNFLEIGSVVVNPLGDIIVTDVPRHRVYEVRGAGVPEVVAGTGFPRGNNVGRAFTIALPGARSVAYLPIGGYFVGLDYPSLDQGARVWYVDSAGNAAPFVFGKPGVHAGDGAWFQKGGRAPKISTVKSVSIAPSGDIILVEGNGFVRKIEFLRNRP